MEKMLVYEGSWFRQKLVQSIRIVFIQIQNEALIYLFFANPKNMEF